jgi:hypothetical protein
MIPTPMIQMTSEKAWEGDWPPEKHAKVASSGGEGSQIS